MPGKEGSLDNTFDPIEACNLLFSVLEDQSLSTDADVSLPKCVSRDMTIHMEEHYLTCV